MRFFPADTGGVLTRQPFNLPAFAGGKKRGDGQSAAHRTTQPPSRLRRIARRLAKWWCDPVKLSLPARRWTVSHWPVPTRSVHGVLSSVAFGHHAAIRASTLCLSVSVQTFQGSDRP